MAKWTEKDIPDLSGKVIIITGANSGLGFASARMMAANGGAVILGVRSLERGQAAAQRIQNAQPSGSVKVMHVDLANLVSVKAFVAEFSSQFDQLDILMNNAGVMATPPRKTDDGFEFQLGINHLGHFALTGHLLPLLKQTPGSRVVNVSSLAADSGTMNFGDLMRENNYSPLDAYSQSKLANLVFTQGLNQRLEAANLDVIGVAAHPGASTTELGRYIKLPIPGLGPLINVFFKLISQPARVGARSQMRVAVAEDVSASDYYGPHLGMWGKAAPYRYPSAALNQDTIDQLWQASEELTGVVYSF